MLFPSMEKFADRISDEAEKFGAASVICLYAEAAELLAELIKKGYGIASCFIGAPHIDHYHGEFLVLLSDCEIYVEPVFKEDEKTFRFYFYDEDVYVHEDCNSRVLEGLMSTTRHINEFGISDGETDERKCSPDCEWYSECHPAAKTAPIDTLRKIQSLLQELHI